MNEELETHKVVDDLFAFFEAHPEIEKQWVSGGISLEKAQQLFEKWIGDHEQNN